MIVRLSSTRALAHAVNFLVRTVAALLGPARALRALGHVRHLLTAQAYFAVGDRHLSLVVLDRQGAYWALQGNSSEPETRSWIDGFDDGDVLYDVGANIGLYSLYAASRRNCRCVALEPNPFSFDALIRNMLLNHLEDAIIPLCMALGDDDGLMKLGMVSDQSGSVGSTLAMSGDGRVQVAAMVTRLDSLTRMKNLPFPNHIKIDVDGIEEQVLAGGRGMLSDVRIKSVLIEISGRTPQRAAALSAHLESCGLLLSRHEGSTENWIFRRSEG
jgi:FkbM family methyltransferase